MKKKFIKEIPSVRQSFKLKPSKIFLLLLFSVLFHSNNLMGQNYYMTTPEGYGAGATGGGNATPTTVTSESALNSALTASGSKVILVSGTIKFSAMMKVKVSNKTIIGLPGARFVNNVQTKSGSGILYLQSGSNNVIIRNIIFEGPGAYDVDGNDNLTNEGTNVWVDHCEFQDGMDGNFDNKGTADNVTVSWCKFTYLKAPKAGGSGGTDDHRFSDLIGSSSSNAPSDGHYSITWTNCYWANGCKERMPRARNSQLHILNCYYNTNVSGSLAIGLGGGTHNTTCYVENSDFAKIGSVFRSYVSSDGGSIALTFSGCLNGASNVGSTSKPSYKYTVYSASQVASAVGNTSCGAGATLKVSSSGSISSSCSASSNTPPTVSLTSPANNSTYSAPASITISANASDADGSVSKVDFYNGSTLLGSDASSPYSFTWSNVGAGTYSITAKATDNSGASTTSSAVKVIVNSPANVPPTVSISSPSNNASFTAPASITINANASDADGSVSKVDFYNGSTLIGSDASSPYSFTWSNVAAGTYSITAKATDNSGATATSSAIKVTVNSPGNVPPTVSISSPSNNGSFTAPASITINANASDADGSIAKVDFYNGSTLLGSDASSPYSFTWTNVAAGTYTITAKATDNSGATATSSQITIVVNNVTSGTTTIQAETACTADGILCETKNSGYNGSCYVNLNNTTGTTVSWAVNSTTAQSLTLTFRYANQSALDRKMSLQVNGTTQIGSISFPSTGSWTSWTTASVQVNFTAGYNNLKLVSLTSEGAPNLDELTFNSGSISAASCTPPNQAPSVSITSPSNNASFNAPAIISITATASDTDGSIAKVDFYNGSTLIGSDAGSPYSIAWSNVAAGTYSITAKATDNRGAVTTSSAIKVTVNAPVLVTIQAETACAADGILCETKNSGYHGSCYVDLDNAKGTAVSWAVNSTSAQTVNLTFRYANQSSLNRKMSLKVNGTTQVSSISFPSTGSWKTWSTADIQINLSEGYNTIKLVSLTSEGAPNLDELTFNSGSISPASCTTNAPIAQPAAIPQATIASNPTETTFTVSASEDIQSYTVLDQYGTVMETGGFVQSGTEIGIGANLKAGSYILQILYSSGVIETKRLMKN